MIRTILTLGNPALYEISSPVTEDDLPYLGGWIADLHDTLMDYRAAYGAGRAVAAPQIAIPKRLIYMHIDRPCPIINPELVFPDDETYEVLDDCMSFPGLMVRVMRHKRMLIRYLDQSMKPCEMALEGDLAELLQHEYDHLDGVLATMRAIDNRSLILGQMKRQFT